jgi:hypothetical protein
MDSAHLAILKEALETIQRKEELDRAVGRAVRRRGLDFKSYVDIMGEVRDLARAKGLGAIEAAKLLVGKAEE